MDIQHLKCLFSVLSTNSFTEAGEMLHISQSGLSKQIVAVENELGIKILERNIRNIVLTPEGHRLMTHFIGILQCYDRLWMTIEDIKREKSDKAHVLKLIGVPPISKYNIISLIGNFSEQYANIEVVIEEMEMNLLLLTLQYGDYDLACCTDIQIDHMHYMTQVIQKDVFMIAVSNKHSLAKKESIRLTDLKDWPLIFNRPESLLNTISAEACQNAGFVPNVATYTRPTIALEYLKSSNNSVYLGIGAELLTRKSEQYSIIPIEDSPTFDFSFIWKRNTVLSEAAETFLKFAASNPASPSFE